MRNDQNQSEQSIISKKSNAKPSVQISRRQLLIALGGITGMAVVSVACGGSQQPQGNQGGPGQGGPNGGQGNAGAPPNGTPGQGGFTSRETPAPELPTTQADARGIFVRRQDASLFIGTETGGRGAGNGPRSNGTPGAQGTRRAPDVTPTPYNGPTQEVVTNSSTKLYKDVTQYNFQPGQNNANNNTGMQQKVEAAKSLDDLLGTDATNGTLTVWGTKNGDQLVASVVVYRPRVSPQAAQTPSVQ